MSGKSYTYSQVVDAVLRCGPDKWYSIGLKLGYTDGEINSATAQKPTDAGKLQAIINLKTSAVGEKELAKLLLEACANIRQPIIGEVKQYLDPTYDPKAGVVTIEGSASGIQKPGAAPLVQPATRTSEADQVVGDKEIVKIVQAIEGFWDSFAVQLDPHLFRMTERIQTIKTDQRYPSPNSKAQFMLETWKNDKDKGATRRLLIETLCEMGKVKQANDVFGESLTAFVRQHKTNVIDGPLPPDKQTDPVVANPGPGNGTASVKAKATPTVADDSIDIIIMTATDTEFEAVTTVLEKVSGKALESNPILYNNERVLHCMVGTWRPSLERHPRALVVGVIKQVAKGSAETSNLVSVLNAALSSGRIVKNGLVAMIGMLAGKKDSKVSLGDVLVPWEIALAGDGASVQETSIAIDANIAKLPFFLMTAVDVAVGNSKDAKWLEHLPEEYRHAPSPRYLIDATLFALKEKDNVASVGELYTQLIEKYSWPPALITKKTVNEALENLLKSNYIDDVDDKRVRFRINEKGKDHVNDETERDEFPHADSPVPNIYHDAVIMGHTVMTGLNKKEAWDQLRRLAAKRKAIGYEMEGHTFLDKMGTWCQPLTSIFIKAVADFATEEYKMEDKYFQQYTSAVAAAFFFHFLTVTEPANWQTVT